MEPNLQNVSKPRIVEVTAENTGRLLEVLEMVRDIERTLVGDTSEEKLQERKEVNSLQTCVLNQTEIIREISTSLCAIKQNL